MVKRRSPRRHDRESGDPDALARDFDPLEDPARASWERFSDREDQYDDLIHTGLIDSRYPRPRLPGSRSSPWLRSRATFRSRVVGRRLGEVLSPAQLLPRALACAGRVVRREVLFALRRTGKGAGARRRVRKFNSRWRC